MNTAEALAKLDDISDLEPDWDGLGADAPNEKSVHTANWLVLCLSNPDRVVAAPDGSIVFERCSDKVRIEVEIWDEEIEVMVTDRKPPEGN